MKWYEGLLTALLCVLMVLSFAAGVPKKDKTVHQTAVKPAFTPSKHGSGIDKSPKLSKRGIICPDQKSECPYENTCCKLFHGGYGCCPLQDAVCCSNGKHCCPHGYTCQSTGECAK